MSDLRKAAELAFDALDIYREHDPENIGIADAAHEALRQVLAQPEQDELLKQGWRQCAIGQRTTQYCGMAEQARLEEREACAKLLDVYAPINLKSIAAAIRARSEK